MCRALHAQLEQSYGALTPEYYISNVVSIVQTGDVHVAVSDLSDQFLYVSYEGACVTAVLRAPCPSQRTGTRPHPSSPAATQASSVPTPFNAYDRQFTRLNLTALFAEPRPGL